MIETNMQHQQQDTIFQQLSSPHTEAEAQEGVGTGPTITCSICDAMYVPSPQQVLFLQDEQGALEATFMGICHFCFRCRRAACPQCWDEVHGVCGSCVQEAGLPFRASAPPLDGLLFPPAARAAFMPALPQSSSLFVLARNGRFYRETQVKPEPAPTDITTEHSTAAQPAVTRTGASDSQITDRHTDDASIAFDAATIKTGENFATTKDRIDTPAALAVHVKIPAPEDSQETRGREKAPRIAKKAKKASRLELVITWIVLVVVLALIVVIALAEFIPAVNVAIARVTHIDIHGEIAYLVHIVQQLFKR